MTNEQLVQQS